MAAGDPQGERRDIIVVGTSAGGVDALKRLVRGLPEQLAAALFVVLHVHPEAPSLLVDILQRETALQVVRAENGSGVRPGRIYVAEPDRHLLLENGKVRVALGPKENGHRPSIDVLFRSAASVYGPRVVGVVLTGTLSDGALGLWAVRSAGGLAVVQDPDEAAHPDMPRAVLDTMTVDHCLGVDRIATLLAEVSAGTREVGSAQGKGSRGDGGEERMEGVQPEYRRDDEFGAVPPGTLSAFTCPACGGALWELAEEDRLSYRCHVGHGFSQEALVSAQNDAAEYALYAALRALKERIALARRLSEHYTTGLPKLATRHAREADELERHAEVLARMLAGRDG